MSRIASINEQLRDRLEAAMLTPSQLSAREWLKRMDFPPHKVINLFGAAGCGKSFLASLLQREGYASIFDYGAEYRPTAPRLLIDKAPSDTEATRSLRPLANPLGLKQIILFSRNRAAEPSMPCYELSINEDDLSKVKSNLYRYLNLSVDEADGRVFKNYSDILKHVKG